jgi:hypothetical protein
MGVGANEQEVASLAKTGGFLSRGGIEAHLAYAISQLHKQAV